MTCGNHIIIDMGKISFPVTIMLNEKNEIIFEIVGEINSEYSKEIHQEIITESFEFVDVSIKDLIWRNFPDFENELSIRIIGFWIYKESEGHLAKAKWENSIFEWINLKN